MRLSGTSWVTVGASLLVSLLAGVPSALAQQTGTIRGMITDSTSREPVPGAQVRVVGSTVGALSTSTGAYVIHSVTPGSVQVRVQRVGYAMAERTVTVAAGDTAVVDFSLKAVATVLAPVVAIGYGTENRTNITGAVSSVSADQITNQPVAGIDAALQGKAPGVQVMQNSGDPGNGISIRVRGAASISASNQPLYVVDGVPVQTRDFAQLSPSGQGLTGVTGLDPNDIESITVLKDASAAAIYGSRASNGVVLITTKRGVTGPARFSIDAYLGWQNAERKLDLMNAQQYVAYMNEGAVNDGDDIPFPTDQPYANTNWQDAIFRTAPVGNAHLSVSGGSDRLRYYLDGSYFGQQGIVLGSKYARANGRVNVDYDASSRLTLKSSFAIAHENTDRVEGDNSDNGIVTNAIGLPQIYPVMIGTRFSNPDDGLNYTNPVAIGNFDELPTITDRFIGNIDAAYNLSSHFSLTGRLGADVLHMREDQWQSPLVVGTYAFGAGGVAKSAADNGNRYLMESFVTYQGGSDTASSWTIVGGASLEYNKDESNFIRGEGFSSADLHYIDNATNIVSYGGTGPVQHNLVSYFARANYAWKDRYLLSASMRADGSSRFGPDNRYGYFPALSAGWLLSDESFMSGFKQHLGSLKLRGSFGVTGNQELPNFAYAGVYGSGNYGSTPGIAPATFGNPDLKWESTKEWDAGLDWSPLGGRLTVIADYYHKLTSDLLVNRPIPGTTGYQSYWDNIGNVMNRGFELGLQSVNFNADSPNGFTWRTDFNIAFNHNEVTELYKGQPIDGNNFRSIDRVAVGYPIGEFYVLHFLGVDPQTGDAMYQDVDGDGAITSSDRTYAGSPQPKFYGGFRNTWSWHGVSLAANLQFSQGAKVFNLMRIFADDGGYHYDNKFTYALSRWQKPGDITDEPRASFDGTSGGTEISDHFIEDGSYLRVQEVTLSWRLPKSLLAFGNLQNSQLYVSGFNLHNFTKYTGYDPDVNSNGSSANIELGTDYYAYPRARTIAIGLRGDF